MSTFKPVVSQDSFNNPSNSSSASNCVESVAESEESEAFLLMKEKLPPYVVDSFVAAGFDTLKVLSEMESDDLNEVEQHITNEFKGDGRFKTGFTVSGNFKFLPGHRKRIINFIGTVQQQLTKNKLMKKSKQSTSPLPPKKRKISNQANVSEPSELEPTQPSVVTRKSAGYACQDQFAVVVKIRQQVNRWLMKDIVSPELKALKENVHFAINVEPVGKDRLSLCMNCGYCGKDYTLGFKDDKIYLSNWTRHVPSCMKKYKNVPVYKCKPIQKFFPSLKVNLHKNQSSLPKSSALSEESNALLKSDSS